MSLEERAAALAGEVRVTRVPGDGRGFAQRVVRLRAGLAAATEAVARVSRDTSVTPEAEWLLDNRYLVLGAADQVLEDVPRGFFEVLPKISEAGTTRVERLAVEIFADGGGYAGEDDVRRFVRAYQSSSPLDTGELWALPAFIRLVALDTLLDTAQGIAETAGYRPEGRVAGAVTTLRSVDQVDWKGVVESLSVVDRTLRGLDPADRYGELDFETRDRYRKAVEELARWSGLSEARVARETVILAREPPEEPERHDDHVGAWLIGGRRRELEAHLQCRPPPWKRVRRALFARAGPVYFGARTLGAVLVVGAVLHPALGAPLPVWALALLALAVTVPALSVSEAVVNLVTTLLVRPRVLPKMDFSREIPDEFRTCVAVPALLGEAPAMRALARQMETNYLGNAQDNFVFALLVDPPDADTQVTDDDAPQLAAAEEAVRTLNLRHGRTEEDGPFLLLVRPRAWNPGEGRWMAWERKRGKLREFNRLLLRGSDTGLEVRVGRREALEGVRFVLTLDADTFLPRGAASRLAGTLAHPLNRPVFDARRRLVHGYTVVQPRVDTYPGGATRFSRIFQGDEGLDLYSHASSDVYQDLFGRGIYAGKGIYDVEAFEGSLDGRVPENALLSHDLFEGVHGRVGLASDVGVLEDYPDYPVAWMRRLHRWVRGDWQLLPWLLPRVPSESGGRRANELSFLSRWQIADNLRRSLMAPSLVALAALGWTLLPGSWWWTGVAVAVPGVPVLLGAVTDMRRQFRRRRVTFAPPGPRLACAAGRWGTAVLLLPWESAVVLDAVGRTLFRLTVSRRHLLQWVSAQATATALAGRQRLRFHVRQGAAGLLLAVLLGLLTLLLQPGDFAGAWPLLLAWVLSPLAAWWLAGTGPHQRETLSEDHRAALRRLARRTWAYFERFVTPEDHWLPPDHVQLEGAAGPAHRTSPTNIGMGLLAPLLAHDLGYLPLPNAVAGLSNTLDTLKRLERHRGHLLNWYDTRTLHPLPPRYVSAVDSGNLAACLMAVREGLREIAATGPQPWTLVEGAADAVEVLAEVVRELEEHADSPGGEPALGSLEAELQEAAARLRPSGSDPRTADEALARADAEVRSAAEALAASIESGRRTFPPATPVAQLLAWVAAVELQLASARQEIRASHPWIAIPVDAWAGALPAGWVPLRDASAAAREVLDALPARWDASGGGPASAPPWVGEARAGLEALPGRVRSLLDELHEARSAADELVAAMDFRFLYDGGRQLLHVGYDVDAAALDRSYYDLFASEARLAGFVAMAADQIPPEHWLRLGRPFASPPGGAVLLSWAGTMFEYLLPALFLDTPEGSLSDLACRRAVDAHVAFGAELGIPWGVSESGYHEFDDHARYRYRAFGLQSLALRRPEPDRVVVAPYASALALPFRPRAVHENLERLRRAGLLGPLGFYEAADYGIRPAPRQPPAIVRSVMVHHQGMSLAALHHVLTGGLTVARMRSDPGVASLEYLLHERSPQAVRPSARHAAPALAARRRALSPPAPRSRLDPDAFPPPVVVVSNGTLSTLLSASGGGGLRWKGLDALRWRPDPGEAAWGSWLYVRDLESGAVWSATRAPTWNRADHYEVVMGEESVEFQRDEGALRSRLTVAVSPMHDVELRRMTLVNEGNRPRTLELTSLGEVALARPGEDRRHPAFQRLFVEAEHLPVTETLLFRRRSEGLDETPVFLAHTVFVPEGGGEVVGREVERGRFFGRPCDLRRPQGVLAPGSGPLHGAGPCAPLDPVFSLTARVVVPPGSELSVHFATSVAASRATALSSLEAFRSAGAVELVLDQMRDRQRELRAELGIDPGDVEVFQRLLTAVVHPYHGIRHEPGRAWDPTTGGAQETLWSIGVSGDLPVVGVETRGPEGEGLAADLLEAHAWWERQGVRFDLVIVGREPDVYGEPVRNWLTRALARAGRRDRLGRPAGVHYALASRLGEAGCRRLEEAAALFLREEPGTSLAECLDGMSRRVGTLPVFVPVPAAPRSVESDEPVPLSTDLEFFNGTGGFRPGSRDYVIHHKPGAATPAPWVNVVANRRFGFLCSEVGSGFTWDGNAGERRLTPWSNDPVRDPPGETLYLRDEETGEIWSLTPEPAGSGLPYEVSHAPGRSTYAHGSHGLEQRLELFLAGEERAKVLEVRLTNRRSHHRRLTLTCFVEWVLGPHRWITAPHLVAAFDRAEGAILVHDRFAGDAPLCAFLASDAPVHGFTCDRTEFLGPEGRRDQPAGLVRVGLAEATGAGMDPCGALQVHLDLESGASRTIRFFLGSFDHRRELAPLLDRLRDPALVEELREHADGQRERVIGAFEVRTPEPSMDRLLNGWLLQQTLASRIQGRTGFYQSGGAFGFRDQLQDTLGLLGSAPELCREQLLEAAARQFPEGDVLHWWHPGTRRGIRSRCSDDLLWLPYATAAYVHATGDDDLLDADVPFLSGRALDPGERERYDTYEVENVPADLYDHCVRALERSLGSLSPRGVPLMGTGDWNDGMNRVGAKGRGESFWLGWFLRRTLLDFAGLAGARGDQARAARYRERADALARAVEAHGWDGSWYLRATYDDGTPLGSAADVEARIDSLAQSWAVLAGGAEAGRAQRAMDAVQDHLVDPENRLVLLLRPPFHETPRQPGYIRSYPPGVRENGGQYTHAATWVGWAFAQMGDGERAEAVFRILNPILRTTSEAEIQRYRVEPYVVAADIYGGEPWTGRGGWTWYTGSAAWLYRLGLEAILGIRPAPGGVTLQPCIPPSWDGFEVTRRVGEATYRIHVLNPAGLSRGVVHIKLDGEPLAGAFVATPDDGADHDVLVVMGEDGSSSGQGRAPRPR
ncbi:MAG: glucoamylase family protein [Longimicrobiales bacterium]|nr:glucoamylase family protein [Longimicrobiales bacterium]